MIDGHCRGQVRLRLRSFLVLAHARGSLQADQFFLESSESAALVQAPLGLLDDRVTNSHARTYSGHKRRLLCCGMVCQRRLGAELELQSCSPGNDRVQVQPIIVTSLPTLNCDLSNSG